MTSILLVRHGQSEWNALGKWQGQADPPLTDLGRIQARHAAGRLPAFDLLASSTLQRAAQTADEIAAALDTVVHHREPGIVERDAGEFSGLTRAEIEVAFPGYLDAGRWPDGWEYDDQVLVRVLEALDRIVDMVDGGTGIVITHGGIIYAIEASLGAPFERVANLGGRWLHHDGVDLGLGERVHLLPSDEETTPDQI